MSLKYLSRKKADALRDELLAAVREVKQGTGSPTPGAPAGEDRLGEETPEPEEETIVEETLDLSAPERAGDSIGVRLSKRLSTLAGDAPGKSGQEA